MNERIIELADKAGNHADTYDDANGPIWFQMYNEKFAELIVKECSLQCNHNDDMDRILEHFGVE